MEAQAPYPADYYSFHHFLVALGMVRDRRTLSHRCLKILFGVNHDFRIRLDGDWYTTRLALIPSQTAHWVDGSGDWQTLLWIYPETKIAKILQNHVLRDQSWYIQTSTGTSPIPHLSAPPDWPSPEMALALGESILSLFGIQGIAAGWDSELRQSIHLLNESPNVWEGCAFSAERREALNEACTRVLGTPLQGMVRRARFHDYVQRRRLGATIEEALIGAGLAGWDGLQEWVADATGFDVLNWEKDVPYPRVWTRQPLELRRYQIQK
ncbi:MAG: hypothetical protein MI717_06575 [Spirochaetales bacterium]|nr:hypothetical protein [Spirochaetales bacterium]